MKYWVLDTSVLLVDPAAFLKYGDDTVVLPITTVKELEEKRHHPDLGYLARRALHGIDDLRTINGLDDFTSPLKTRDGGTVLVGVESLTASSDATNDEKITAVAKDLFSEGKVVTLVSQDLPLRILAGVAGLKTATYEPVKLSDDFWTGIVEIEATEEQIAELESSGIIELEDSDLPENSAVILKSEDDLAMAIHKSGLLGRVPLELELFGAKPRNQEQAFAMALLNDPDIPIVSLSGKAGAGKTLLALAGGLEAVLERREHQKIMVFRPLEPVGGKELGYYPGSAEEKMSPWAMAIFDQLNAFVEPSVIEEIKERQLLEISPLTHLRGRSLHNAYVILEEAQNLERNVLTTVLSRLGERSKLVITHDVSQRDNYRVGRSNGIAAVVEKLKGQDFFSHIQFKRSERSRVAEIVSGLLDEGF